MPLSSQYYNNTFQIAGQEDRTICFHCGGGLNEWKEFDEPWVEHAFWFPNCHYVLSVKGKEYVNGALNRRQEAISLRVRFQFCKINFFILNIL